MTASPQLLERPRERPEPADGLRPARSARPRRLSLGPGSDDRLARRAGRGDRGAIGKIFERYRQELYRFCLGLMGNSQDAEDALQNTMVKVLRALPGEEREIALRPWLYRIARNEAIEIQRTRRETDDLDAQISDRRSDLAERAEQRERLEWLFRDLDELPERQRAALVMRELSGLDFADIGAALDTSGAVVRQSLYEARRNLEQMDFGRSLRCDAVARVLSDADGRTTRRRDIRAHLRDCSHCRRFQKGIGARREALAAISPLPVGAAATLGSSLSGGSGGSGVLASLGGGAAKSVAMSGAFKAAATVAVVAAVGTAVDRGLEGHAVRPGGQHAAPSSTAAAAPGARPPEAQPSRSAGSPRFAAALAPPRAVSHLRLPSGTGRQALGRNQADGSGQSTSLLADTEAESAPAAPGEVHAEGGGKAAVGSGGHPAHPAQDGKDEASAAAPEGEAAPGGSEHPAHPEHPEHPAHPERGEAVPVSTAAAAPAPERAGNGLAKGHEK